VGLPEPIPAPVAGCSAAIAIVNQWPGGYQAQVTVTAGTEALSAWRVTWSQPADQTVAESWSARVRQSGAAVEADSLSWNAALAPGASTTFGFSGTYSGPAPVAPAAACTRSR
jgi:cellulase/cellobiase CelA1